jgi:hypothetical protein
MSEAIARIDQPDKTFRHRPLAAHEADLSRAVPLPWRRGDLPTFA